MSDSGSSAVGTFVVMGVAYLFAEALATMLVISFIGAVVAIAVLGVVIVVAIGSFIGSLGMAIEERNIPWVLDHFLAPLAGALVATIFFGPILHWSTDLLASINEMEHSSLIGIFVGLALGILGLVIIFGAPCIAVLALYSDYAVVRLLSYAGFIVTGAYWGMMAIMLFRYHGLPPIGLVVPECNCIPTPS